MRRSLLTFALALCASPASAQHIFESVGERALGMAGAFVAVADDSTAVYWNPSGLVHGQPLGATIGWHRSRFGNPDAAPHPGAQTGIFTLQGHTHQDFAFAPGKKALRRQAGHF